MPEGLNIGMGVPGSDRDYRDRPKQKFEKAIGLTQLCNWIRTQGWDDAVKEELIKRASAYPFTGLKHFIANINEQVIKIELERKKKRQEKDEREMQLRVPKQNQEEGQGNAPPPTVTG